MAEKMTSSKTVKAQKPKIDNTTGLVPVVGSEKSEFLKTGHVYEVSEKLAETLVKKGSATYKK